MYLTTSVCMGFEWFCYWKELGCIYWSEMAMVTSQNSGRMRTNGASIRRNWYPEYFNFCWSLEMHKYHAQLLLLAHIVCIYGHENPYQRTKHSSIHLGVCAGCFGLFVLPHLFKHNPSSAAAQISPILLIRHVNDDSSSTLIFINVTSPITFV